MAAVCLAIIVAIFGVAIVQYVPLDILRPCGWYYFGALWTKWLKKALLRYSGLKALHDEEAIYEEKMAELKASGEVSTRTLQPAAVALSFKSVLLEGLEVAFIVITFGSTAHTSAVPGSIGGIGSSDWRARRWSAGYSGGCAGQGSPDEGSREHPQICGWYYVDHLRYFLDC